MAETKKITEDYRMQLLAMDAEMTNLKDLANANKEVLKSRTKSMVDTVDTLKERYEGLEKRRKNEGEGYQSDIKLLKQKVEHLEQKLVLSAVTKTKGKSNLCLVNMVYTFWHKKCETMICQLYHLRLTPKQCLIYGYTTIANLYSFSI